MEKKKILFICNENTARSQMAEAFMNEIGKERYEASSAGLEIGVEVNPYVIEIMSELGYDISLNEAKDAFELYKAHNDYDYIITLCDEIKDKKCPEFPGIKKRLHWGFPDPSSFKGAKEDILFNIRKVRDSIKSKIEEFVKEN